MIPFHEREPRISTGNSAPHPAWHRAITQHAAQDAATAETEKAWPFPQAEANTTQRARITSIPDENLARVTV